jgi:hypothetical protein
MPATGPCPACGTTSLADDDDLFDDVPEEDVAPSRRFRMLTEHPRASRPLTRNEVRLKVSGPASYLVILGAIGLLISAGQFCAGVSTLAKHLTQSGGSAGTDAVLSNSGTTWSFTFLTFGLFGMTGPFPDPWVPTEELLFGLGVNSAHLACQAFIVWSAWRMLRLKGYRCAVAAGGLATFGCLGCCFGTPLGIWAVYLLQNPEVRKEFT